MNCNLSHQRILNLLGYTLQRLLGSLAPYFWSGLSAHRLLEALTFQRVFKLTFSLPSLFYFRAPTV